MTSELGSARCRAVTAVHAPVRAAVMTVASITASGTPVSGSFSTISPVT